MREGQLTIAEAAKIGLLPMLTAYDEPAVVKDAFLMLWEKFGSDAMPVRNYRFMEGRRFRADFAWPKQKVIVDIDVRGKRVKKWGDASVSGRDKLIKENGWTVLVFTWHGLQYRPLQCCEEVEAALGE